MDPHAQREIVEYATAIHDLVHPIVPITMNAFKDYQLDSIKLSSMEIEAIKTNSIHMFNNKTELKEYQNKRVMLGLD